MKLPGLSINLYKVAIGVLFSLLWGRVMYMIWDKPSYFIFIWFYLGVGSVILKWVIFEIIDRIRMRIRLKQVERALKESRTRVQNAAEERDQSSVQPTVCKIANAELQDELKQLERDVTSLADMVERALGRAVEGLKAKDLGLARQVIEDDRKLDLKESAIRDYCMQVLGHSNPSTGDLCKIVAVLGMITELERMGDYADGIAKITLLIGAQPHLALPAEITLMAQRGKEMLRESLASFLEGDIRRAVQISKMDDQVDASYERVFRGLLLIMIADTNKITEATWIVWAAHNLERFADRVTNICEWAVFSVTGEKTDIGKSNHRPGPTHTSAQSSTSS